jgi:hypothetical protein
MEITGDSQLLALHEGVSEYAKTVFSFSENMRKENKRTWRKHQEYFVVS